MTPSAMAGLGRAFVIRCLQGSRRAALAMLAASTLLAACGGGGGDTPPPVAPTPDPALAIGNTTAHATVLQAVPTNGPTGAGSFNLAPVRMSRRSAPWFLQC